MRKSIVLAATLLVAASAPAGAVQLKNSSGTRLSAPISRNAAGALLNSHTSTFARPPARIWSAPAGRNADGLLQSGRGQRMGIGTSIR